MGFKVNQAPPGWPQQLAMSTGKNSDLGMRKEKQSFIHLSAIYLLSLYSPPSAQRKETPAFCNFYPSWEKVSTNLMHREGYPRTGEGS